MYADSSYSHVIRSDFNEITNLIMTNQLKENLLNQNFRIWIDHYRITSDLIFIKKFVSQINELRLNAAYGLNSNDIEEIKYTLSNLNIKVSFASSIVLSIYI